MSDEHKPHADEAHAAPAHDEPHAPDHGYDAVHTTPEAEFAASESDTPVEAVSDGHTEHHEPVVHQAADDHVSLNPVDDVPAAEPPPAVHDHAEPVSADTHHDHAEPVAAVAAAAAGAAAATSATRRPIWSDHGDAPFEEEPAKPVKSRKIKGPRASRTRETRDRGAGGETLEILKTIVFALLIAFVLRVLLFQPFTIPSASMEPNLYEGDYIVVTKWSYGYSKYSSGIPINLPIGEGRILGRQPNRGDIVVFKLPRDNKTDFIKRVIGLPGDRIQMIANKLYVNGQPVQDATVGVTQVNDVFGPHPATLVRETFANGKTFLTQDFGPNGEVDDTPVYEVPQGMYFMMGDNRDNSVDSRYSRETGVGLVPAENLVGKAQIIMFSWSPGASLFNPVSWFSKIRPSRFFRVLD